MKARFKNLFNLFGALGLVLPFAGCETDAEETAQVPVSTNIVASASTNVATTNTVESTAAPASPEAALAAAGTNQVANQQAAIVNRIPPTLPANLKLSKGVEEIVKLTQAGVSETVLLLFIEKSAEPFALDAAHILYLNDIGIPSTVLAAMLSHDGQEQDILHDALNTSTNAFVAAPPALQPAPPPVEVSSNYVAAPPQYASTVDPNAQQPVLAQQQPVVVEQQPVVVTQPAVTYSYFYSSLSPYGSWVDVPEYGWAWQPTIAISNRGWRPYVHGGRWLHSNAGWYWSSDYSWGWAPFHYGRWYCSPRAGWVWTPDYTWGPSWVTWRQSGDYCGWAPLPPRSYVRSGIGFSYWDSDVSFSFGFGYTRDHYAFVPTRRFCDRRVIDHVVRTENTGNIYKDSTVVNNYIVGNNNTIINNGIGRDYVANHTRGEIPRVRVAEAASAGRAVAPDRIQREGTDLVVYRPNRPSANLVAAHESAVARTRGETARPAELTSSGRGNLIPGRTERPATASPSLGAASTGRTTPSAAPSGRSVSRSETARPQVASRGNQPPVFGTPAPIRPEPDRSSEIIRSRSAQESLARPSGQGSAMRPNTTGRTTVTPANSSGLVTGQSVRPGAPTVSTRPGAYRGEIGRGTGTAVTAPSQMPAETIPTARPTTTPPGRQTPATSPGINRRNTEPARSPDLAAPQVNRPAPAVTPTPSYSRPAPVTAQPPAPIARGSSSYIRPAPQSQGTVNISPQPIQRGTPTYQAPAPAARPNVINRSESFSRPSSPVRSAPAPSVVQPRSITPVQPPVQRSAPPSRPQMSNPSYSAPVRNSPPPSSAPRVNTAPSGGGYRSSPPAQAPSRPSPQPSQNQGRGRVEIGR